MYLIIFIEYILIKYECAIFKKNKIMFKTVALSWLFAIGYVCLSAQVCLDFDGDNDFIQTQYEGVFSNNDRTFEAWINISPDAPSSNMAILDYGVNSPGSRNTFIATGAGILRYISGGNTGNISSPPGSLPIGKWVHVAYVYRQGKGYLFVNGEIVKYKILPGVNTPSGNQSLKIGQRVDGGSIPFHGQIDEVRIWDVARTQEELKQSMNIGYCTANENLKLYMPFNEGLANDDNTMVGFVSDLSGNGYDGELKNFALTGSNSNWVEGTSNADETTSEDVDITACNSYFWSTNSITYDSSGLFTANLIEGNAAGCDSIINMNLTIEELNTDVILEGSVLSAENNDQYYQWIDCSNQQAIANANQQSFEPLVSGEYAVVIYNASCSDTSECFFVVPVGVDQKKKGNFSVYPNPSSDILILDFPSEALVSADIYSSNGILAMQSDELHKAQLDVSNLEAGMYLLKVYLTGAEVVYIRFIKD